jgi:hypothetical protein
MTAFAVTGVRYRRRERSHGEAPKLVQTAVGVADLMRSCETACGPSSWPTRSGSSRSPR